MIVTFVLADMSFVIRLSSCNLPWLKMEELKSFCMIMNISKSNLADVLGLEIWSSGRCLKFNYGFWRFPDVRHQIHGCLHTFLPGLKPPMMDASRPVLLRDTSHVHSFLWLIFIGYLRCLEVKEILLRRLRGHGICCTCGCFYRNVKVQSYLVPYPASVTCP